MPLIISSSRPKGGKGLFPKEGKRRSDGGVRIKQTTVRRNLSSPFPEIGRVANVPRISFPNNIGRLASSPRGTASDE
jgi:hypothetical protein